MGNSLQSPGKSGMVAKKSVAKTTVLIAFATTGLLASLALPAHGFLPSLSLPGSFHLLWLALHLIILAIWCLSDAAPCDERKPQGLGLFTSPEGASSPPPTPATTPADEAWYDVASFATESPPEPESESEPVRADPGEKELDEWGPAPAPAAEEEEEERDSIEDTWKAIIDGGGAAAAPVLRKSDTWERPHRDEMAAAAEGEGRRTRKSETFKEGRRAAGVRREEVGWRRREVLVVANEELFLRVETLIKKHHDHLRLQRQESERRRFLERMHRSY